jgi:predicted DNA-binding transcriptional regulator AlpA
MSMENLDSVVCGFAEHGRKRQWRYSWQLASNTNRGSFRMAGSVICLKELVEYMGLSRSAIYERMDKTSPHDTWRTFQSPFV